MNYFFNNKKNEVENSIALLNATRKVEICWGINSVIYKRKKKLKRKKFLKRIFNIIVLGCGVCLCGWGWVSILWCFPGWWSLCLCSGWWSWSSSLWRAMQCSVVGFRVSMGSECLWTILVFTVLRQSIFAATSKWPSQRNCRAARPAPYLSLWSLPVLLFPCPACTAGRNLLGRCLYGSFCIAMTCVGFPQPPSSPSVSRAVCTWLSFLEAHFLCHGLVCTCLSFPGSHFASQGLCALVSALLNCLLWHGVYVHLFHFTACTLCHGGYFPFFQLCRKRVVCAAQICMPPLYWHPSPALCTCCICWLPGSALCAALARFVFPVTLSYLGLPSVLQGLCALAGFVCHTTLGSKSLPSVWGPSPLSVNGLRNIAFSVYYPPSPSKSPSCLVFQDFVAPLWARLWGSFPVHRNSCFRAPSLLWDRSSCPEVFPLFPFYVSLLSPTSFQGA